MKDGKKIYLIRHGKPELPGDGRFCIGRTDLPLSQDGFAQSRALKKFLSEKGITPVFSSPLKRALQTALTALGEENTAGMSAEALKALAKECGVIVHDKLSEIDMGVWDGLEFKKIKELYPEEYAKRGEDIEHYRVSGGESFSDLQKRAVEAFDEITCLTGAGESAAVFAHSGVFRVLLCALNGQPLSEMFSIEIEYTGVVTIDI